MLTRCNIPNPLLNINRYQGQVGAALILGGVDLNGPQLFTIYPHGSTDKLPYVTMGSGSLAAMAMFEAGWKPDMSREDAMELVKDAIEAGIFNDLGSGSNVDLTVITEKGAEVFRNYAKPNERVAKELSYKFPKGTTGTFATCSSSIASQLMDPRLFSNHQGGYPEARHHYGSAERHGSGHGGRYQGIGAEALYSRALQYHEFLQTKKYLQNKHLHFI